MKRIQGYHLLFGAALVTLVALCAWWTIFFMRAVELERTASLNRITHAAVVTALMLGHAPEAPEPGPVKAEVPLEVIHKKDRKQDDIFAPAVPRYPEIGVRPAPASLIEIEEKVKSRRFMMVGEGSLLFLLLGICTIMLYRLVRQERSHMRRMEAFVSAVTHEMKTPLAGVKSMLQTFSAGKVPDRDQDKLYAMGLKETERLDHMINNILLSGRLRTQRHQVSLKPVSLFPLIDEFVEHRRRFLFDNPQALRFVWKPDVENVHVLADTDALSTILENLTDNAFKYGGKSPVVVISIERKDGHVLIAVEDSGTGFDQAESEEMFVPFKRMAHHDQGVQHGAGLGLWIARTLARKMTGDLSASSGGPGKGSRFIITLKEAAG